MTAGQQDERLEAGPDRREAFPRRVGLAVLRDQLHQSVARLGDRQVAKRAAMLGGVEVESRLGRVVRSP